MINILEDYIWRSVPEEPFRTNPNLRNKVDENKKIQPYKGNTVVFLLDEDTNGKLAELQAELYEGLSQKTTVLPLPRRKKRKATEIIDSLLYADDRT